MNEKIFLAFYAENTSLEANTLASRVKLNKNLCGVGTFMTNH